MMIERRGEILVSDSEQSQEADFDFVSSQDICLLGNTGDSVKDYLIGITKVPLLTANQEVILAQAMEAGKEAELHKASMNDEPKKEQALAVIGVWRALAGHTPATIVEPANEATIKRGEKARNHFIASNLRLVVNIANRYTGKMDLMENIAAGTRGLMKAVDKFEWRKGFKFSTYATWWIRQGITRNIADTGRTIRLPVHAHEQLIMVDTTEQLLLEKLGRQPTQAEIASEAHISEDKLEDLRQIGRDTISLDVMVGEDEDMRLGDYVEDASAEDPQDAGEKIGLVLTVEKALSELTEKERAVIVYRWGLYDGQVRTFEEVGEVFGLTRERMRQIQVMAFKKLKPLLVQGHKENF